MNSLQSKTESKYSLKHVPLPLWRDPGLPGAEVSERIATLKIIKGNLFDSKDSLSHCVSEDLRMGAGIALQFRQKIGRISELKEQKKKGDVAVLKEEKRFIYYLVTKDKYYQKPSYENLKLSLIKMKKHMCENNVTKLSIPKIGCGLDKLDWNKVLKIIKEVLSDIDISVYVI